MNIYYKKYDFFESNWQFESDSILVFSGLRNLPGQEQELESVCEKIRDKLWELLLSDWRYPGHFRQSDRRSFLNFIILSRMIANNR